MGDFTVIDGEVAYKGAKLGAGLIADFNELKLLTEKDGVTHMETPLRIDMLFASGDKVVGVESKKPSDLITSYNSRRLARQFATLLEAVDIPVLLKRGAWPEEVMTFGPVSKQYPKTPRRPIWWHHDGPPFMAHRARQTLQPLWVELARWQQLGGLVLEGPGPDHLVPGFLAAVATALADTPKRALVGSDYRKGAATKEEWAMLRVVPGIGGETIKKLKKIFANPWEAIKEFMKDEASWPVSDRVKENMKVALTPEFRTIKESVATVKAIQKQRREEKEPELPEDALLPEDPDPSRHGYASGCLIKPTRLTPEFLKEQARKQNEETH